MKYFEDNIINWCDLHDLHDHLHDAAGVAESNIVFILTHGHGDGYCSDVNMCQSAYNVIAVCEAIIAAFPEDVAEKALANARSEMLKVKKERSDIGFLLKVLFGRGC